MIEHAQCYQTLRRQLLEAGMEDDDIKEITGRAEVLSRATVESLMRSQPNPAVMNPIDVFTMLLVGRLLQESATFALGKMDLLDGVKLQEQLH